MKINYLRLERYKRFPLFDNPVFEYTFNNKITMVAGVNGSGKSSLINELSPLPADKNDFWKNGYKEIHIQKEKQHYKLISDFREGTKYHFIVDGVEQNIAGNVTTQKDLVFLHFNITPIIHDILTDKETFSGMSLVARKKLCSLITHINIDKVLENYNTLKEELKNNEVILKNQTTLYQTEEEKLANNNHIDYINDTLSKTKEHIDFLLDLRTYLHPFKSTLDPTEYAEKIVLLRDNLKKLTKSYFLHLSNFPEHSIQERKLEYTSSLNVANYQLNEFYTTLEKKQDAKKVLVLNKQSNLSSIAGQLNELAELQTRLLNALQFFKDSDIQPQTLRSEFYKLESTLPDLLHTLPNNPLINEQRKYTKTRYETLLDEKKQLLNQLTNITTQELTLQRQLTELSQTNDNVTCPSCSHSWSLQDTPAKIQHLKEHQSKLINEINALQNQLKKNESDIEEITNYFTLYRQYMGVRSSTHETFKPFWDFIDQEGYFFSKPQAILPYLNTLVSDINTLEQIKTNQQNYEQLSKTLETLSSFKDTNDVSLEEEITEILFSIDDLHCYKNTLTNNIKTLERVEELHKYLNTVSDTLERSVIDLKDANVSYTISELLTLIEADLSKYKIVLIELEKEKHRYDTIQYTLDKYRKTIEDCKTNIKVLKLLLDELSPKNGLIAKSISSFLNIIVTNVNKTLSGLWSYKMVLKPIDVETHNLDYRFKLTVEDKLEVNDISTCSRGMKNAIDLAFKLLMYKLLDLEGGYLALDELGSNLDKEHTTSIFNLVQQLASTERFSQLFIISHKENLSYMQNVDVIQLS